MGRTFATRVAVQEAVITRDAAGGVLKDSFQTLPGCGSIPAVLLPTVDEKFQERFDNDEDTWHIILGGHWPQVKPKHFVLHGDDRYEVHRASTTKRSRVTTVIARLGGL